MKAVVRAADQDIRDNDMISRLRPGLRARDRPSFCAAAASESGRRSRSKRTCARFDADKPELLLSAPPLLVLVLTLLLKLESVDELLESLL